MDVGAQRIELPAHQVPDELGLDFHGPETVLDGRLGSLAAIVESNVWSPEEPWSVFGTTQPSMGELRGHRTLVAGVLLATSAKHPGPHAK